MWKLQGNYKYSVYEHKHLYRLTIPYKKTLQEILFYNSFVKVGCVTYMKRIVKGYAIAILQVLCLLENNLKGLVIKCSLGKETIQEGTTMVGANAEILKDLSLR